MTLKLHLDSFENWDPVNEEFIIYPPADVELNHCLLSIAKWEEIWKKPYIKEPRLNEKLTFQEAASYIECMVEGAIPPYLVDRLNVEQQKQIADYIQDSKTATKIRKPSTAHNGERLTSELLYFYLSAYQMPFDICERWHLSRLITLIEIASIKNTPEKKMGKSAILKQNSMLNKARRAGRPG